MNVEDLDTINLARIDECGELVMGGLQSFPYIDGMADRQPYALEARGNEQACRKQHLLKAYHIYVGGFKQTPHCNHTLLPVCLGTFAQIS